jgi:hypothetical protein
VRIKLVAWLGMKQSSGKGGGKTGIRLPLPVPEEVGRHHQPSRRFEEECHLLKILKIA